ncbi:MAG: F0F1 ATP synthase subunit delta, partial [Verrucomicrobiota bacterium]
GQLSADTLNEIHDNLKTHYAREIDLITAENPELIAGFRVHIADDVYDASVSGRLHALELATKQ